MDTGSIIILVAFAFLFVMMKTYYDTGKKALSIFPDINTVKIVYRDRGATGYSKKSWKTSFGGASRSIDIVVTEDELWFRAMIFFAGITRQHDMLHRVPIRKVINAKFEKGEIVVAFKNDQGESKQVVIRTRDEAAFMKSIGR